MLRLAHMAEQHIVLEELPGGLQAAFVNLPHFRTAAARLTIHSGSLHEDADTAGAAHFLEHITFQGTEALPSQTAIHRYSDHHGLYVNAFTGQTETFYVADGYELEAVGHFVVQTALRPLLTAESLEAERNPVVDEQRGYASNPSYRPTMAHDRALRGERYARPIVGSLEDILKMNHEHLIEFHERNYRLGNAALVLCSSQPIERQREYALSLIETIPDNQEKRPVNVELPSFNPSHLTSSLEMIDLPPTAQTEIGLHYGLPDKSDRHAYLKQWVVAECLSRQVYRHLRSDLALCYGADARLDRLSDLHFGRENNWSWLSIAAKLEGRDSCRALDTVVDNVLRQELPIETIEGVRQILRHDNDRTLENNPMAVADFIRVTLSSNRRSAIDLDELRHYADDLTIAQVRQLHRDIIDTVPLVTATSPDYKVLDQIGNWASAKRSN